MPVRIPCEYCHGAPRFPSGEICSECRGSGYRDRPDSEALPQAELDKLERARYRRLRADLQTGTRVLPDPPAPDEPPE